MQQQIIRIDETKPYGKVCSGHELAEEFDLDRTPFYEQDGMLFDSRKRAIIKGQRIEPDPPPAPVERTDDGRAAPGDAEAIVSPIELIRRAGELPWPTFRKRAKAILGDTCPQSKAAILEALKAALQEYEQRLTLRRSANAPAPAAQNEEFKGMAWDTQRPEPMPPTSPPPKPVKEGEVDLAAYARGQKDYLFGDVMKAMRAQYHVQFTERRDVVNFLVDNDVIPAHQARKDV